MESYIVRLYRRDADQPGNLVGLVETVGQNEQRPFHNAEELVAILSEPHPHRIRNTQPVLKVIGTGKGNTR
jgi:hypothetical protein